MKRLRLARQVGLTSARKLKRTKGSAGDSHGRRPSFYATSCPECGQENKVAQRQTAFKCSRCNKAIKKPLRSGNF